MKKILFCCLMAAMALATVGCSKDDEPSGYENTYDGVSIYLNAIETLYNSDAEPAFTSSGESGVYVAVAESSQDSFNYIARLIENPKWDGKDVTVKLGEKGENGSLRIVGENATLISRGIYNEIIVDIKDYTPYTLKILTSETGENGYGHDIVVVK